MILYDLMGWFIILLIKERVNVKSGDLLETAFNIKSAIA